MKKQLTGWLAACVALILWSVAIPVTSHAASTDGAGFTLKIKRPANTLDPQSSYFNLLVKPGDRQLLTLTVHNQRRTTRKIRVTPVSAYTSNNGYVTYKPQVKTSDTTAKQQFTDLVSGSETATLGPNQTKSVMFLLTIPAKRFAGMIMGGFQAVDADQTQSGSHGKGFSINNRYALIMGATVQEDRQMKTPELEVTRVTPQVVNKTTVVSARVANQTPTLFGQLKIKATVTKAGDSKVLHGTTRENLTVAPASVFDFQTDWDHSAFQPGKYTLHLVATSGTKTWRFTEPFTVSAADARRLNKQGTNLKHERSWWWLWILLVILLLVAMYYYGKYRERKRSE